MAVLMSAIIPILMGLLELRFVPVVDCDPVAVDGADEDEWELEPQAQRAIDSRLGPSTATVHLFDLGLRARSIVFPFLSHCSILGVGRFINN